VSRPEWVVFDSDETGLATQSGAGKLWVRPSAVIAIKGLSDKQAMVYLSSGHVEVVHHSVRAVRSIIATAGEDL